MPAPARYFGVPPRSSYWGDETGDFGDGGQYFPQFASYNPEEEARKDQLAVDYRDIMNGNADLSTEQGMSGLQRLLLSGKVNPQQARAAIYGQRFLNPTQRGGTAATKGPGRYDPYSDETADAFRQLYTLDPNSPTYEADLQDFHKNAPSGFYTDPRAIPLLERHQNNISQLRQKKDLVNSKAPIQKSLRPLPENTSKALLALQEQALSLDDPEGEEQAKYFTAVHGKPPIGDAQWSEANKLARAARVNKLLGATKFYSELGYTTPDVTNFEKAFAAPAQNGPVDPAMPTAPRTLVATPPPPLVAADLKRNDLYNQQPIPERKAGFEGLQQDVVQENAKKEAADAIKNAERAKKDAERVEADKEYNALMEQSKQDILKNFKREYADWSPNDYNTLAVPLGKIPGDVAFTEPKSGKMVKWGQVISELMSDPRMNDIRAGRVMDTPSKVKSITQVSHANL